MMFRIRIRRYGLSVMCKNQDDGNLFSVCEWVLPLFGHTWVEYIIPNIGRKYTCNRLMTSHFSTPFPSADQSQAKLNVSLPLH